jgi:ribosomal protein S18 acetylase RimI-like enzyme
MKAMAESQSIVRRMEREQSGDQVNIRTAVPADVENIARLVNDAFGPERFFVDGDRTNPDKVRILFQKGQFLLAEEAEKLVGCVYVELRDERGYFGLLSVIPARQRGGLGSRLMELAENYCREAGCVFMDLTMVNLRTELYGYYRKHGYLENGTLPFPKEQHAPKVPCHLVKMFKPLA